MEINNRIKIQGSIYLVNAFCKCGKTLQEMPNGWLTKSWVCLDCLSMYELELRKTPARKVKKKVLKKLVEFEKAKAKWVRENRKKFLE